MQISGGLALTSTVSWPFSEPLAAWAQPANEKLIVEGFGRKDDYSIKALTRKVFEAAGGIQQFVSKQDVVVIKPNIW